MSWIQDLRFGLRGLARSPGFTLAVVLTLALGIGANVALFSIVNTILLRPLPYPESNRLVRIWSINPERGLDRSNVNPLDFEDWERDASSFSAVGGFNQRRFSLTGTEGNPELLNGLRVTEGYFRALRAQPTLGRVFTQDETASEGVRVVVLSHALWRSRYGADPSIVNTTTTINEEPFTIVGVLAQGFAAPGIAKSEQPALFVPLAIEPWMGRGGLWLGALGKLAKGATLQGASQTMNSLATGMERNFPETNDGRGTDLQPLKESIVGSTRPMLVLLLSTVGLLLLIACANVTNLFLARSTVRQGEFAVRLALGAGLGRLVRQLATESLIFSLLGGAAGLMLGQLILKGLQSISFLDLPQVDEFAMDGRVLVFTFVLTALAGFVFGAAPFLRPGWKKKFGAALTAGRRSAGGALGNMPKLLVIAEVALALVLLCGAGLLLRSFSNLLNVDVGFEPDHLAILETELPESRYEDAQQAGLFYNQLLDRVQALPNVKAATMIDVLPFGGSFNCSSFDMADGSVLPEETPCVEYRNVGPDYFKTLGIRLLRGTPFLPEHNADALRVAVVNETLARQLWPNGNGVGQYLTLHLDEQELHQVVGVVGDVHHFGLAGDPTPEIYISSLQHPSYYMTLVARALGDSANLPSEMRTVVRQLDSSLPIVRANEMAVLIADSAAKERLRTLLLTAFASLAVILAAIGVFAVVAFGVSRRTHEIGLRMALGADRKAVLVQILRESMASALAGIVLGIVASLFLAKLLRGFLFQVSTLDPAAFTASAAVLALVVLLATLVPAYRASVLEPSVALQKS